MKDDKKVKKIDELGLSEITALLIKTKSPIANINLPRSINRESSLQAANPACKLIVLPQYLISDQKVLLYFL